MRFAFYDLGQQPAGATAMVRLRGSSANVLLLDKTNFDRYRTGGPFAYSGGHYNRSPVALEVPEDGHWFVVLDLGGFGGRVRGKVRVLAPGETDGGAEFAEGIVPAGA
jgi:hypothetical protein